MSAGLAMEPVDFIVWPRWLVPVVPPGRVLTAHGVAVRDGRIVALVPADGLTAFEPAREIHLPSHALVPGLVNAHTHGAMNLLRGIGDDMPLMPWLEERIWPIEGRFLGAEFVRDGSRHAIAEMIRGGITTASDMYFFPEATLAVAREAGFRMVAGMPVVEFPTAWGSGPDEYLAKAGEILGALAGEALVGATLAPHAPYTVADGTFRRVRQLAERHGARIHVHLHETAGEVDRAVAEDGRRPFDRLEDLGLVDERLIAVHMTTLSDGEIERLAEAGAHVVHCPESNLKLASGFAPVSRLLEAGVNVALGTDGAASNNDLDLLGELRTAALLAKAVAGDPTTLDAPTALAMATLHGARALGMEAAIGSIEVGKRADLTAVELGTIEAVPVYEVVSALVYATGRHQVSDVWIDGRRVLDDGTLTTIDEDRVVANVTAWEERIREGDRR